MNWFRSPPSGQDWFSVGRTSTFPNIGVDKDAADFKQVCRAYHVPPEDSSEFTQVGIQAADCGDDAGDSKLHEQVIVFQYKGKFHAIDHQCPHNSYALSEGSLFDIEDFGIVLSAGITCPKHGWSFDLFTGGADHGRYQLKIWDVELREIGAGAGEAIEQGDKEVWVRRRVLPGRSANGRIG